VIGARPSIGVEGKVVIMKILYNASSCEAGRSINGNEGELPRVPNGIQNAMSNGGGDGGDGDIIHGKDGLGIPSDFFEPFLVGYGLQDELEVEGEGWVVLAEVDEGDDVFFLSKEVAEVNGGGGERSRVECRHDDMRRLVQRKLAGLVVSVRQLSGGLLQTFPPFIILKNLRGILQVAFWLPCFVRVSLPYYQILIASALFPVIFD